MATVSMNWNDTPNLVAQLNTISNSHAFMNDSAGKVPSQCQWKFNRVLVTTQSIKCCRTVSTFQSDNNLCDPFSWKWFIFLFNILLTDHSNIDWIHRRWAHFNQYLVRVFNRRYLNVVRVLNPIAVRVNLPSTHFLWRFKFIFCFCLRFRWSTSYYEFAVNFVTECIECKTLLQQHIFN